MAHDLVRTWGVVLLQGPNAELHLSRSNGGDTNHSQLWALMYQDGLLRP